MARAGRGALIAVLVLLLIGSSVAAGVESGVGASRAHSKHRRVHSKLSRLPEKMGSRASLMFRSIDKDHSHTLTKKDALAAEHVIRRHLPGLSTEDFIAFLEVADVNHDGEVSKAEFMRGLSDSLDHASLLETDMMFKRTGFIGKAFKAVGKFVGKVVGGIFGKKKKKLSKSDKMCVVCQYIVERVETNIKAAGVVPAMSATPTMNGAYIEEDATSLLEVQATTGDPMDVSGAAVIGSTRQSTRFQRQLERQKFNEIYRVTDVTLDDVCEQGMPPGLFYSYCKAVYKQQSDIVDGLRYQYRPADICFRVGMCGKSSYITQGIHSRYRKN